MSAPMIGGGGVVMGTCGIVGGTSAATAELSSVLLSFSGSSSLKIKLEQRVLAKKKEEADLNRKILYVLF